MILRLHKEQKTVLKISQKRKTHAPHNIAILQPLQRRDLISSLGNKSRCLKQVIVQNSMQCCLLTGVKDANFFLVHVWTLHSYSNFREI